MLNLGSSQLMNLKIFSSLILLIFALSLSSCSYNPISAQTDYLSRQGLASYHVGTPDPSLNYPVLGQRLIIKWVLKENYLKYSDLHAEITVRFQDNTEKVFNLPIKTQLGTHIYIIEADEFCKTNGIASYKVDLIGNGYVLYKWRHQLWVDKIISP